MAGEAASEGTTFEVKRGSGRSKPGAPGRGNPLSDGQKREQVLEERDLLPSAIRRKYYVPNAGDLQNLKICADPKGKYLVLHVRSDRLTTRIAKAEIVRDMVAIAAHRGWTRIELAGSVEFRREAWLAASARGIEAKGYEATPLDRAASAKVRDTQIGGAGANTRREADRAESAQGDERSERNIRERDGKYESRSRGDCNGRSQLAVIERVALAAFPKDADARRRLLEVARERLNNHRRQGARFQRVEISERSGAKVRTADQTPTPSSVDFHKLEQGRGGP